MELLVVIAIIAVLMAILMPSLSLAALQEPGQFQFYRTPQDEDEWKDLDFMLKGYAYRALL
ncbi:MAG: hypothetical protein JW955_06110 [Sedimentisphaerales bacterium]|nr:hypothetical protein [Sedimentisphaerales bacterium]